LNGYCVAFYYVSFEDPDCAKHNQDGPGGRHFDIDLKGNACATVFGWQDSFPYIGCWCCIVFSSKSALWLADILVCRNTSGFLLVDFQSRLIHNMNR
jgi:hypothetical protein